MRTDELDFELPPELIAQTPTEKRGESRLLHYQRQSVAIAHHAFADLPLLEGLDHIVFATHFTDPTIRADGHLQAPGSGRPNRRSACASSGANSFEVARATARVEPGNHAIRRPFDTPAPARESHAELPT